MTDREDHANELMGQQVSIAGAVLMDGSRRHPRDTETSLCLTLYGQDGVLGELMVERTRSNELFQEWLRRFDRRSPGQMGDEDGQIDA